MRVLTEAVVEQARLLAAQQDPDALANLTLAIDDGSWESACEISGLLSVLGMELSSVLWYMIGTHRKSSGGVVSLN